LHTNPTGYLLDTKVPGIVKGSAKMVDTKTYFTTYELQDSSVRLDMVCNNSNNLRIAIGYKSPAEDLMKADNPAKEVVLWSGGNLYPESCLRYKAESTAVSRITNEWDLLAVGFTVDEYVQADERIWYLRINELSSGPYGYERGELQVINGTEYLIPEFIPNMHYIKEFKLVFNTLIFETLLYPFFDGSTEIIIPIRGVSHELAIEDQKTNLEIRGMSLQGSWSTTTTPGDLGNDHWVVVFGTSNYDGPFAYLDYPPMECRSFILGCARSTAADEFKVGIMDYGWRVAYCMDGNSSQTDIATTTKTDDDYLKAMLDYADGELGNNDQLIVFVAGHGVAYTGQHNTVTTKTKYRFFVYTNTVKLTGYEDKVDDITTDGTYVLLWISACHGWGLNNFPARRHNYKMESWSFRPEHIGDPSLGVTIDGAYTGFCWLYVDATWYIISQSEAAFFFCDAAAGAFSLTVSTSGNSARNYYNNKWEDSTMYIQKTWGDYEFYVNQG
jgi:hypothetical protein